MTEMQAAIGRIQLRLLPQWQVKRLSFAQQIWQSARENPILCAPQPQCDNCVLADNGAAGCQGGNVQDAACQHAAYKCYIFVKGSAQDRDAIMAKMNDASVPCYSGSCSEVYLEKAFDDNGWRPKKSLPVAKKLGETSLVFLCLPTLSQEAIDFCCQTLSDVCNAHQ